MTPGATIGENVPSASKLPYNRPMPPHSKAPPSTMESVSTVRERISLALRDVAPTAREISQRASVPERDVAEHLRHLEHSLAHVGERLSVSAPHCVKCGLRSRSFRGCGDYGNRSYGFE
jgi:predicted Zn-ribbon and HTH transcriptional regulator